jgi:hypothetical protein
MMQNAQHQIASPLTTFGARRLAVRVVQKAQKSGGFDPQSARDSRTKCESPSADWPTFGILERVREVRRKVRIASCVVAWSCDLTVSSFEHALMQKSPRGGRRPSNLIFDNSIR